MLSYWLCDVLTCLLICCSGIELYGNVRQVAGQPAVPEPAPRSAAGSTTSRQRHPHPHAAALVVADALWDRNLHPNQGPRADQNLLCLTVCCAGPWLLCPVYCLCNPYPVHCLSAWGCADCVGRLTAIAPCGPGLSCKDNECCPCSPNSENPLCCAACCAAPTDPLGSASRASNAIARALALIPDPALQKP